jgi:hypothetical protein
MKSIIKIGLIGFNPCLLSGLKNLWPEDNNNVSWLKPTAMKQWDIRDFCDHYDFLLCYDLDLKNKSNYGEFIIDIFLILMRTGRRWVMIIRMKAE